MAANPLIFQSAEQARDAIQASQKKEIAALYEQWAKQIGAKAVKFSHQSNLSAPVSEMQMRELEKMLQQANKQVTKEVNGIIVRNMYCSSNVVVQSNAEWLKSLGFDGEAVNVAFSNVPTGIVQNIVTGNIYQGRWNLSSAIWGSNEAILKDVYGVVAAGVAQNLPTYEIAKLLEQYVKPSSKKPWNLKAPDGKPIYRKQVDYSAQRLARTLVQHSYQQAFVTVTKYNPMVIDYIWNSNGSRVCEICKARDGKHFAKNELPMDHPNGMCVMVPNVDSYNKIADRLADWVNGKKDPALDEYAGKLGFNIPKQYAFNDQQQKYLSPYGFSPDKMPKDFDEWSHKVSYEQAAEILKSMGTTWGDPHPYQVLQKYYNQNLVLLSEQAKAQLVPNVLTKGIANGAEFASKYGTSKGAKFNYWYTKLSPEAKEIAKQLKEQSGLTWQEWYEANIKVGSAAVKAKAQAATVSHDVSSWIAGVKKNTEERMLASEARSFAAMTDVQSKGIKKYTGSAYEEMNKYLRLRAGGLSHQAALDKSGIYSEQLTAMRNAMDGLKKVATTEELYLRRGTDLGDLAGLLSGDFQSNLNKLQGMSFNELRDTMVGTVGKYAGFTSTSSMWGRGFSGSVEVVFHAPKGTAGSSIMSISNFGTDEGEFLLNAGTKVEIIDIQRSDGHMDSDIRVFMEIVPK